MEFIRGLERALELGVTREDFLKAWAVESSKTALSESTRSLYTSGTKQIHADVTRDPPRYDDIAKYDQLAHQLKKANDELKADFRSMLQTMFSQHAKLEEQRWAQFKAQVTNMEKEFQHQNELLCQHINNTIESQSTSLTSNFTKELDLLKRDVERIIEDRCIMDATTPNSPVTSSAIYFSCHDGDTPIDPVRSSDQTCSLNDHNVAQAQEDETSKSQATCESIANKSDQLSRSSDHAYSLNDHSVAQAQEDESSKSQATCENIATKSDQLSSGNNNASQLPVDGRNGNRTDYEMNKRLAGSSVSLLDADELINFFYYKTSVNSGQGVTFYDNCDEFTIPDIDEFSSSHRTFVRKVTLQPEQFWRARLIIKFNAADELKVELRVSEGQYKSDSRWPLKIQGVGHIHNPCSRRFSEIWEIMSVTCNPLWLPPSDKYVVLPAKVCLSTTRNNYPDVTYKELESKNYVDNDTLMFKWSLKVESV